MSSVQLLDKTRKIGKLLHSNTSGKVVFNELCRIMKEILGSNVVLISKKGKILGLGEYEGVPVLTGLISDKVGTFVDKDFNARLLGVLSTKENVNLETLGFDEALAVDTTALIAPVEISGVRLGTLFVYKKNGRYDIDDIILCEYGTTVVGLEMTRSTSEESAEEKRRQSDVASAIGTLSYSEMEAITYIFDELQDGEGILVASRIADRVGITRSVIVNALRKFESAGVIESRSAGMKGTSIKVRNDAVYEEMEKLKEKVGRK